MAMIGLDIGGSKIEGILFSGGKIVRVITIKTPERRAKFLRAIEKLIRGIGELRKIKGIGVALAGAIDQKRGRSLNSPNIRYLNNFPIRSYLQKKFHKAVALDNDTNCFLLAESYSGQARGKKNVVALTLGTGIGGAVLVDGKLLRGKHGAAGELGHMIMEELPRPLFNKRGEKRGVLDLEDLITRDRYDYPRIGKYLGMGLANLVNIFDPDMIVLGGGISRDAEKFLPGAIKAIKKYSLIPSGKLPPVKVSKLKHAGALGAAALFHN